jgi:hypothetical protein
MLNAPSFILRVVLNVRYLFIMQESLQRIIISLVLPQFPWLQGFDIKVTNDRFYEVVYYPKSSYLGVFTVVPEFKEVEDMTKSLFKMLGIKDKVLTNVQFKNRTNW